MAPPPARLVGAVFRAWSRFYDHPIFQKPFYRRVHAAVQAEIDTAPHVIVDLGCGTALLTWDLAQRFPDALVMGADRSPAMLKASRRRGALTLPLLCADAYALPLRAGSVDLVVSTISYHFYLEPRRALSEIRRLLRPGGRLILATMATWFLRGSLGYLRLSTTRDVQRDLEAAGFATLRIAHVWPAVRVFVAS